MPYEGGSLGKEGSGGMSLRGVAVRTLPGVPGGFLSWMWVSVSEAALGRSSESGQGGERLPTPGFAAVVGPAAAPTTSTW